MTHTIGILVSRVLWTLARVPSLFASDPSRVSLCPGVLQRGRFVLTCLLWILPDAMNSCYIIATRHAGRMNPFMACMYVGDARTLTWNPALLRYNNAGWPTVVTRTFIPSTAIPQEYKGIRARMREGDTREGILHLPEGVRVTGRDTVRFHAIPPGGRSMTSGQFILRPRHRGARASSPGPAMTSPGTSFHACPHGDPENNGLAEIKSVV